MSKPKSVIVIGGGITGVATAIQLQQRKINTTLIDPGDIKRSASYGNGGVIACCACVPVPNPSLVKSLPQLLISKDSPLFLTWAKLPMLLPWLSRYLLNARNKRVTYIAEQLIKLVGDGVEQHKDLIKDSTAKKYLVDSEYLYIYQNTQSMIADDYAWSIRRSHGFNPEIITGDKLIEYAGAVASKDSCGYLIKDHAMVTDPGLYVKELTQNFVETGGNVVTNQVLKINPSPDYVEVVIDNDKLSADVIAITAGVWSWDLAKQFGATVKIESERGYHIELADIIGANVPILDAQRKVCITPMNNRIRISGLVDLSGIDAAPKESAGDMLRRIAAEIYPHSNYQKADLWMGHRPAPWDSLPLLGRLPASDRLFIAAGLHHVGLTGGPKLGLLLAQMINQEETAIDVAAFSPSRG